MSEILLTLIVSPDVAEATEDLLLSRPDLVRGFTSVAADGHGSSLPLLAASELVSGHSPRLQIQTIGSEAAMRDLLALLKTSLPRANLYYWMVPVIAGGKL